MKPSSLLLILFMPLSLLSHAAEQLPHTRSFGKLISDPESQLDQSLSISPVIETTGIAKQRTALNPMDSPVTQQSRLAYHPEATQFNIFDAWLELSSDNDHDGFYHRLKVSFDADVDSPVETVYAKLYLSYEGGPWYQYSNTELFEIYSNSADDGYEVDTELVDGYLPGYYEVLIEIHSLYHTGTVASQILSSDDLGHAIALEDQQRDVAYAADYYVETYSHGVVGSFSWAGLIMLGIIVLIKFRYFGQKPHAARSKRPGI